MSDLLQRFTAVLGRDKVDEILTETDKQTEALDADGVERKMNTKDGGNGGQAPVNQADIETVELVNEPAAEPTVEADENEAAAAVAALREIVGEMVTAELGKMLKVEVEKRQSEIAALTAQVKALELALKARIDDLESMAPRSRLLDLARATDDAGTKMSEEAAKTMPNVPKAPGDRAAAWDGLNIQPLGGGK